LLGASQIARLIPNAPMIVNVKPLGEDEAAIKGFYHQRLEALYPS
jgi:hypothetical protein